MMQALSLAPRNAFLAAHWYDEGMETHRHEWHLRVWLQHFGKNQADLVNDLDMNKAKVSLLANGKQRYDQDDISLISSYLGISPAELLMHPSEAMAIRRYRAAARDFIEGPVEFEGPGEHFNEEFTEVMHTRKKARESAAKKPDRKSKVG